ncbi:sporulation integral membrane protein YtvI [Paenibacillus sp. 481]|uniref:sporulation integral membrane protein YtvI n=1 Tax=Paenibacillus sp. 481 TaxID=2835869 RepID=UPI001E40B91A|nr:sporulation integral membrane protein YtvI [Paenibacillus sp. 481]UHA72445.1 sporulation integral membrane protein YtvI [Paenibacillus sp. 481]
MSAINYSLLHRIFRAVWVSIVIIAIVMLMYFSFPILYPFLVAWLLAYMMNPFVRLLEHRASFPRWVAVTTALILFLIVITLAVYVFTTKIVEEAWFIAGIVQEQIVWWSGVANQYVHSAEFQQLLADLNNTIGLQEIKETLSQYTSTVANVGTTIVAFVFNLLKSTILVLPNFALITVIVMVATFLISKDWHKITAKGASLVPDKARRSISIVLRDIQHGVFGYLKVTFILSAISAFIFLIGLLILDVKYALTIAIIGGIVDLIPIVGIPAIVVPWACIAYLNGNTYLGTGMLLLWLAILVVRQSIEPKLYATNLGLHPLLLLISLFAGLKLLGVAGIFLGIISLVILTALYKANVFRDVTRYIMTGRFFKENSTDKS